MSSTATGRLLLIAPPGERTPSLVEGLRQFGASVEVLTTDASDALRRALLGDDESVAQPPDAVLLELTDASGLLPAQHVRHIEWTRESGRTRPVMALIRERHLNWPELPALVDDFLLPPYRPSEVLARLALIRQRRGAAVGRVIRIGDLEVDIVERQARLMSTGQELTLTPREYDLLAYLAVHRGRTFTRKMLLEHVWGRSYEGGPRTVDIHVRRLREKLPPPEDDCLETIRHVGYRLREPKPTQPSAHSVSSGEG